MAALYDGNGDRIFRLDYRKNSDYVSNQAGTAENVYYPSGSVESAYDADVILNEMLIPNGVTNNTAINYELTGYINDINSEYTQVLTEFGANGNTTNVYEYGDGRNSATINGTKGYYLYDGRGSVAGLTGNSGGSMITYRYDAYGNTTKSNNTLNNPYQYNAEYTDSSTGLQYLRARYYDSSQGRFTTKDTLLGSTEKPITRNLYTYCGNNPLNITDPSGHGWWKDRWEDVKTAGRWVNNHVLKPIGSAINDFVELQVQYYNMDGALRLNPRAGQPGEPMYLPPVEMSDPFKPISDKILNNANGLHDNKQKKKTYDEDIADLDKKINNATSEKEKAALRKQKEALEEKQKELCKEMNKQRVNIATGVFDYIGYVPYVGAGADAINAILYATQEEWLSSGLCAVSAGVEFASALYILKNIDVPDIPQYNKSQLEEVLDIADNYKLSDDVFYNHIIDRHGYNSSYTNKSHFNSNFDIKAGIDSTLRGNNFVIKPNTQGRSGYIFEQTFSYAIGKNSKGKDLYTIKVVIDEYGNVVTAFPIK